MDTKLIKAISEIGFDNKEIDLLNKVYNLKEVPHGAFKEVITYFIKESYRKGVLKGIVECEEIMSKNIGRRYL